MAPRWSKPSAPLPDPEALQPRSLMPEEYRDQAPTGFHHSIEIRMTRDGSGPIAWTRTPLQLIEGEPMTPPERCAALADLAFGIGTHLVPGPRRPLKERPQVMLINVDTTLHLERPPQGVWFALAESCLADRNGVGLSGVTIHGSAGRVGRATQTLMANEV